MRLPALTRPCRAPARASCTLARTAASSQFWSRRRRSMDPSRPSTTRWVSGSFSLPQRFSTPSSLRVEIAVSPDGAADEGSTRLACRSSATATIKSSKVLARLRAPWRSACSLGISSTARARTRWPRNGPGSPCGSQSSQLDQGDRLTVEVLDPAAGRRLAFSKSELRPEERRQRADDQQGHQQAGMALDAKRFLTAARSSVGSGEEGWLSISGDFTF